MKIIINGYEVPKLSKVRIKQALRVVQRAIAASMVVKMTNWQQDATHRHWVNKEKEAHTCGTVCCFAGLIGLSPEFQRIGGKVSQSGCPEYKGSIGQNAIYHFLRGEKIDCDMNSSDYVEAMCGISKHNGLTGKLYGKHINEVDINDIENQLGLLLAAQK